MPSSQPPHTDPAMLFLRTFGGTCLLDDDGRVRVADQRMRLALLVLLAVAGEGGLSRDKIVAYLWPDSATEKARHALHQLLYYLRRDVHPDLFAGTDPLRLDPGIITSDVVQFTNALAAGSLSNAVALHTGPFLDGFFLSGAAEFERWVETQRARLHGEFTGALHRLAVEADAHGTHAVAVERWRLLVAAEPLDGRATLGLMRALAAAGDPVTALRQAAAYEELVREELGQACAPDIVAYARELANTGAALTFRHEAGARPSTDGAAPVDASAPVPAAPGSTARRSKLKPSATALAAGVALFAIVGSYNAFSSRSANSPLGSAGAPAGAPALAILPFGVNDPDLRTWRDGALVVLAADVDGVAGLRAIDPQGVLAALGERRDSAGPAAPAPDRVVALAVARRTGARHALVGNIVANGATVRISADVYESSSGRRLRALQVEGPRARIFALFDALAVDVLRVILKHEGMESDFSRVDFASRMTASLPALKAYLEGEQFYQHARFTEAGEAYVRALEADSTFALALARFLVPYSFVAEFAPRSLGDPLPRALGMLDRLPPREALLIRARHELERLDLVSAFELLRQASREYPDDYEVWYGLGETALHMGGDLLLPPDEALRAFSNSVRLNPAFGPSYSHLIDLLLGQRGDSAEATAMNAAYERVAPGAQNRSFGGLALALAFGNSAARAGAISVLDTFSLAAVMEISQFLRNPRFRDAQEQVLAVAAARADDQRPGGHAFSASALRRLGKLSASIATSLAYDACAPLSIYWSYLFGQSGLPAEAEAALQTGAAPSFTCSTTATFIAGAYAADRADWAQLAAARASLDSAATAQLSVGDSANARQFRLWAEALHGYGLARKGETARGIALLQSLQPRIWDNVNGIVRWWLSRLLLEDRRPHEARRYFASFWYSHPTPASYYLARIDEQLGHYGEARAEYAYFAHAWRNADPEVQPMVADARGRLAALQRQAMRR